MSLPEILQRVARRGTGLLMIKPGEHKDLGVLLQRQAFRDPHVLPVYGSSELALPNLSFPTRPDHVFAEGATGFQVCSVGRGGNTSLVTAEKLASLGSEITGKKLVILVSYPWFYRANLWPTNYVGNFSELQAIRLATSPDLSFDLRHRFAQRMLQVPESLKDCKDLTKALKRLSYPDERRNLATSLKLWWLRMEGNMLLLNDYACTLTDLLLELPRSKPLPDVAAITPAPPGSLPGEQGTAPASAVAIHAVPAKAKTERDDDYFAGMLEATHEWDDFELLLDTLAYLKARPLIVTIPMDATAQEDGGISQQVRNTCYYGRMESLCAKRGFAFDSLQEHEHNPDFLLEHRSHISRDGWPYVNQVLDAFYHDLPKPKPPVIQPSPAVLAAVVQAVASPSPKAPPVPLDDSPLAHGTVGKTMNFPLGGGMKMTFCYCPPGDYTMGSPATEAERDDDENAVPVHLTQGFWLARTECSQAQWKAFKPLPKVRFPGDDLPLENVSFDQVHDYLKSLNKALKLPPGWVATLPTEAQWEYACRAGTTDVFNFGHVLDGSQATCVGSHPYGTTTPGLEPNKTSAVASYPANAWGLHDMHGNVWEFCADWYAPALTGGTDPQGPPAGIARVIRGGSWSNYALRCRSATRNYSKPNVATTNVGFRAALTFVGVEALAAKK